MSTTSMDAIRKRKQKQARPLTLQELEETLLAELSIDGEKKAKAVRNSSAENGKTKDNNATFIKGDRKEEAKLVAKAQAVVKRIIAQIRKFGMKGKKFGEAIDLETPFKTFDADGSGELDFSEFKSALEALGATIAPDEEEFLMIFFDPDNSGQVSYGEFSYAFYNHRSLLADMANTMKRRRAAGVRKDLTDSEKAIALKMRENHCNSGQVKQFLKNSPSRKRAREKRIAAREKKAVAKAQAVVKRIIAQIRKFGMEGKQFGEAIDLETPFKTFDADGSGELDFSEFKSALEALGATIAPDEEDVVMMAFDPDNSGQVSYGEFSYAFYNHRSLLANMGKTMKRWKNEKKMVKKVRENCKKSSSVKDRSDGDSREWPARLANHFRSRELRALIKPASTSGRITQFLKNERRKEKEKEKAEVIAKCTLSYKSPPKTQSSPTKCYRSTTITPTVDYLVQKKSPNTKSWTSPSSPKKKTSPRKIEAGKEEAKAVAKAQAVVKRIIAQIRKFGMKGKQFGEAIDLETPFKTFDADGSGELDFSEFKSALEALGATIAPDEEDVVMMAFDPDNSGQVSYGEFSYAFYNHRSLLANMAKTMKRWTNGEKMNKSADVPKQNYDVDNEQTLPVPANVKGKIKDSNHESEQETLINTQNVQANLEMCHNRLRTMQQTQNALLDKFHRKKRQLAKVSMRILSRGALFLSASPEYISTTVYVWISWTDDKNHIEEGTKRCICWRHLQHIADLHPVNDLTDGVSSMVAAECSVKALLENYKEHINSDSSQDALPGKDISIHESNTDVIIGGPNGDLRLRVLAPPSSSSSEEKAMIRDEWISIFQDCIDMSKEELWAPKIDKTRPSVISL